MPRDLRDDGHELRRVRLRALALIHRVVQRGPILAFGTCTASYSLGFLHYLVYTTYLDYMTTYVNLVYSKSTCTYSYPNDCCCLLGSAAPGSPTHDKPARASNASTSASRSASGGGGDVVGLSGWHAG